MRKVSEIPGMSQNGDLGMRKVSEILGMSQNGNSGMRKVSEIPGMSQNGNSGMRKVSEILGMSQNGDSGMRKVSEILGMSQNGNSGMRKVSEILGISQNGNSGMRKVSEILGISQNGDLGMRKVSEIPGISQNGNSGMRKVSEIPGISQNGNSGMRKVSEILGISQNGDLGMRKVSEIPGISQNGNSGMRKVSEIPGMSQNGNSGMRKVSEILGISQNGDLGMRKLSEILGMSQSGDSGMRKVSEILGISQNGNSGMRKVSEILGISQNGDLGMRKVSEIPGISQNGNSGMRKVSEIPGISQNGNSGMRKVSEILGISQNGNSGMRKLSEIPGMSQSGDLRMEEDFHSIYIGVPVPRGFRRKRRRRRSPGSSRERSESERHFGHREPSDTDDGGQGWPESANDNASRTMSPAAERLRYILGEDDEPPNPTLFTEMDTLQHDGDEMEWKESARWIKFEEKVEEGGERWSKPHVSTLSLHSLFELRTCLQTGTVLLDLDGYSLPQIIDDVIEKQIEDGLLKDQILGFWGSVQKQQILGRFWGHPRVTAPLRVADDVIEKQIEDGLLKPELREKLSYVLLRKHRHQTKKPIHRSLADIGKSVSSNTARSPVRAPAAGAAFHRSTEDLRMRQSASYGRLRHAQSRSMNDISDTPSTDQLKNKFIKKIPKDAEASNVLVGEVEFLEKPFVAFVRLLQATMLGGVTEVPVPTRFLFILLGPAGKAKSYNEIGRAIATLMVDDLFSDVAYKARDREDLIAGIDEFLDEVIVLPPGEWDPNIRIEPPKKVPSAEKSADPAVPIPWCRSSGVDPTVPMPRCRSGSEAVPVSRRKSVFSLNEVGQMNGAAGGAGAGGGGGASDDGEMPEVHEIGEELAWTGRFCGGLYLDIKRKLPWFPSDFYEGFHIQSISAILFIYLGCITNAITFGGLLGDATENYQGVMESFLGTAMAGSMFCLFAGQPLIILSSTGPILIFEKLLFDFSKGNGIDYMEFRLWIGLHSALQCLILVATDASFIIKYITRFTEEGFSTLISFIFIYDAIKKMIGAFKYYPINSDFKPDYVTMYKCECVAPDPANTTLFDASAPVAPNTTNVSLSNAINLTALDWTQLSKKECLKYGGSLVGKSCKFVPDLALMSFILFFGTYSMTLTLKKFKFSRYFPTKVRAFIADFSNVFSILIFCGVDACFGLDTPKLHIPSIIKVRPPLLSPALFPAPHQVFLGNITAPGTF
ncbi:hypothetical protein DUI87_32668 [Hirundo rustica rustica]|uniref:Anion exchange protein n=1 Tax=Hirundo rustica rustica TaxID=333673 RepID=A0A3M0ITA0_HIRRU|nr:hypothetical protein DUI87_32668 [Hirundo rustica rustica]